MLKDLVQELKRQTTVVNLTKKEPEMIKKIRKKYESMDKNYWLNLLKTMERQVIAFEKDTPEFEYMLEKVTTEFEITSITYDGYGKILEHPAKIKEITEEVKEKTKEHLKYLECLENIRNGFQLELELENTKNNFRNVKYYY